VAARLQQLGEPGQALVGPVCHEATQDVADFTTLGPVDLKGVGPLPVWRLARLVASRPRARPPFVGREAELELLQAAYRRTRSGRSVLALVVGPPGQGKTRLVEEFVAGVDPTARVLTARCQPRRAPAGQTPFRELLAAGEADPAAALAARVASLFADPTEQRRYLAALAREQPLVVWIEDLHWAEAELLGLLDRLTLAAVVPVLVVATARPELTERAGFRPGGDRFFIELAGLDAADALALARHAGPAEHLPLERAEGNPLFIIELARAHALGGGTVPLSLQGVIGARLDELSPRDRELLQRTAVVGERFTTADAALLTRRDGAEAALALDQLTDRLVLLRIPMDCARLENVTP
jgi:hypothetical protein